MAARSRRSWSPDRGALFDLVFVVCFASLLVHLSAEPLVHTQRKVSRLPEGLGRACRDTEYRCHSGRCIPKSWRCDQDTDCEDGDDETDCSGNGECAPNEYRCLPADDVKNGSASPFLLSHAGSLFSNVCIPEKWRCDGEFDCPKKDDELNCEQGVRCLAGQHQCPSYQGNLPSCIPKSWLCDGQSDCVDRSDEANCKLDAIECDDTEFKCTDGRKCIFKNWTCDGDIDCDDGSDEKNCNASQACNPDDHFMCKNVSFCVPKDWRCDGEADCADQSDELDCEKVNTARNVTCHRDEFRCHTGTQCISNRWVCDGDTDCMDHSDEKNCKHDCTSAERKCRNGVCLAKEKFCDGADDCTDGSDEFECFNPATPPNYQSFMCDSATEYTCNGSTPVRCIKYEQLCMNNNSANDCPVSVCAKTISTCDNRNATGDSACRCRSTYKGGIVCSCLPGFELRNGQCIDIDECAQVGACDQICHNTIGSFKCDCHPGYKLYGAKDSSMPTKCRAAGKTDPLLLLSNRAAIRRYDLITNKYHPLVEKLESAVAMDYWHERNTLIWSDVSKEKIMMCKVDNSSFFGFDGGEVDDCLSRANTTLVGEDILTPDGLAVDWVHGLLFWTDTGLDKISVMDLNTRRRKVIVDQGLDEPRAIAVDPSTGLIFWTDWGNKARIERAGMDGGNRREILSGTTVRWPNGLAVDILEKRIYWADAKVKMISSADYYGRNVRTVLHSHQYLRHPFSLAVFEERLYWTDWDKEGVLTVNKFRGDDVSVLLHGIAGPMTVRVYHEQAQPAHPNKCAGHVCSHLCLPRSHINAASAKQEKELRSHRPYQCACSAGFSVHPDNLNECVVAEAALEQLSGSSSFSLPFLVVVLVLALLGVAGYVWKGKKTRHFNALQFDNPIYRRTTEDAVDFHADNSLGAIPSAADGLTNPPQPRLLLSSAGAADTDNLNARPDFYHPANYGYDLPPDGTATSVQSTDELAQASRGPGALTSPLQSQNERL